MAAFFKLIFALFLVVQVSGRTLSGPKMVERHEQWMTRFERSYKDAAEKAERFKIFTKNSEFIDSFNAAGNRSYTLATNEFTDLTTEEFLATRTGFKTGPPNNPTNSSSSFMYADVADNDIPSSIDWREKGAVTEVKNQGQCGCCWAFSAVAAAEGLNQLSTGQLVSLSEQELVDCDTNENQGCGGGLPERAFDYMRSNNGLSTEADYPYQGVDGSCNAEGDAASRVGQVSGYESVPANSEEALLRAVAHQPVSIGIDAEGVEFMSYKAGVFTGVCGTRLNHAVTIVGYGESSDGMKYWLAKNSWGTGWGEDGYVRLVRDSGIEGGICGIAMQASYPVSVAS